MTTRTDLSRAPSRIEMRWRIRGAVLINLALWGLIILAGRGCT